MKKASTPQIQKKSPAAAGATSASSRPVTVLYLGAMGRSGTTLLERVLGEASGVTAVGELTSIWRAGLVENIPCGCGAPFAACPFWSKVGDVAFGGWHTIDANAILSRQRRVERHRYLPLLLIPRLAPAYRRRLIDHGQVLDRLYRAIATVSGSGVVVDASKWPSRAFLLRLLPDIDARVIHVVRDARGVAFSWTKKVIFPHSHRGRGYLQTYSPSAVSLRWIAFNLCFEVLARVGVPTKVVSYENFVHNPAYQVRQILQHAGISAARDGAPMIKGSTVALTPGHGLAGNLTRFARGPVALRLDDKWRSGLSGPNRLLVTVLTLPLTWYYRARARHSASVLADGPPIGASGVDVAAATRGNLIAGAGRPPMGEAEQGGSVYARSATRDLVRPNIRSRQISDAGK